MAKEQPSLSMSAVSFQTIHPHTQILAFFTPDQPVVLLEIFVKVCDLFVATALTIFSNVFTLDSPVLPSAQLASCGSDKNYSGFVASGFCTLRATSL